MCYGLDCSIILSILFADKNEHGRIFIKLTSNVGPNNIGINNGN